LPCGTNFDSLGKEFVTVDSILHDDELRQALDKLYLANLAVLRGQSGAFTNADATRVLTSLMGSRPSLGGG